MHRLLSTPLLLLPLAALSGCRSAWYDARFLPAPLEVQLLAEGQPLGQARALLHVRGIRRARPSEELGPEVEVLLRLDNLGETDLVLAGEDFDLVAADLVSFAAPRVEPAPGETIVPGEQGTYRLSFPLPPGKGIDDVDWSGLNLRWRVDFEGRVVVTGVTFDRFTAHNPYAYGYHNPFWGSAWPYESRVQLGVGVGATFEE